MHGLIGYMVICKHVYLVALRSAGVTLRASMVMPSSISLGLMFVGEFYSGSCDKKFSSVLFQILSFSMLP